MTQPTVFARGLLARAALHRAQGHYPKARRDLAEALSIATRGGMRLHQADCHLAQGERGAAREHLSQAKAMIEEMGYHRRDGEVAELEEQMKTAQGLFRGLGLNPA